MATQNRVLIHVIRRDLRVSDQPILHHLVTSPNHGFTHLVPVYVFSAQQIDLSGFIKDGSENPYPTPRSHVGNYPRCGPHRAKFLAEAVWDLKDSLESLTSGLLIRAGMTGDVVRGLAHDLTTNGLEVAAIWMTSHEGAEEKRDERAVASVCRDLGAEYKLWEDEKYLIDDRDIGLENLDQLPDIFTTFRKSLEPLREKPRAVLPVPVKGSLPPLPDFSTIPGQALPFAIPDSAEELIEALVEPVKHFLPNIPVFPEDVESAYPFIGGETTAQARLNHLVLSGCLSGYKNTRNGLMGTEFSTKLSAYLAQGCITARQVHHRLLNLEDGTDSTLENVDGYGAGESEGGQCIRLELLWRDYMRLCHQKFKNKVFRLEGTRNISGSDGVQVTPVWKTPIEERALPNQDPDPARIAEVLERFTAGTTGMGLIDASQRELMHTGYTSNRARQNVANFLAKHLNIDWRYGAEWYEMLLVDYDVSSNWGNWQYVSGVGNDPRGEERMFNPVKQAFDYDSEGKYVRSWVPELSELSQLENVFQAWTASEDDVRAAGLEGNVMVSDPILRIPFWADWKPKRRKGRNGRRGGRGGSGRGAVEGGVIVGRRRSSSGPVAGTGSESEGFPLSAGPRSEYSPTTPVSGPPSPAAYSTPAYSSHTFSLSVYSAPVYRTTTYVPTPYHPPPTYVPVYTPITYIPSAYGPGGVGSGGYQGRIQQGPYRGGGGGYSRGGRGGSYRGGRGGAYRGRYRGLSATLPSSQPAD